MARPPTLLEGMRFGCNGRPKTVRICRKPLEQMATLDGFWDKVIFAGMAAMMMMYDPPCGQCSS